MDTLNCRSQARGGRWDEVDTALLALIRLVLDESWSPKRAAAELRMKVPRTVLLRVRTRVLDARADHPTPVAERAALTLDEVFSTPERTLLAAGVWR